RSGSKARSSPAFGVRSASPAPSGPSPDDAADEVPRASRRPGVFAAKHFSQRAYTFGGGVLEFTLIGRTAHRGAPLTIGSAPTRRLRWSAGCPRSGLDCAAWRSGTAG